LIIEAKILIKLLIQLITKYSDRNNNWREKKGEIWKGDLLGECQGRSVKTPAVPKEIAIEVSISPTFYEQILHS